MSAKSEKKSQFFSGFSFELSELKDWILKNGFQFVGLQLPQGLMQNSIKLVNQLETELKITVTLLADPCFGACDMVENKIKHLGIDAVVHFGHTEIPNSTPTELPIKYVPLVSTINPSTLIKKKKHITTLTSEFKTSTKIGILANIQFVKYLNEIKPILEAEGFKVQIGKGDNRITHPGQVLGCNFSAVKSIQNKVDALLFIGDGKFHPLGISLATTKKVLHFDPLRDSIQNISYLKEKILRQRIGAIARAKDCKNFGILISTKPGQDRKDFALKLQKKLKRNNRYGTLIILDQITPDKLDYLALDAYVNTACPRLTIDDYVQYKKVILTPIELEIILGDRPWSKYQFDEIY